MARKPKKKTDAATVATWAGVLIAVCSLLQVLWTQPPWFLRRDEGVHPAPVEAAPPSIARVPEPVTRPATVEHAPTLLHVVPSAAEPVVHEPAPPVPLVPPEPLAVPYPGEASSTMAMSDEPSLAWGKLTFPLGLLIVAGAMLFRYMRKDQPPV